MQELSFILGLDDGYELVSEEKRRSSTNGPTEGGGDERKELARGGGRINSQIKSKCIDGIYRFFDSYIGRYSTTLGRKSAQAQAHHRDKHFL